MTERLLTSLREEFESRRRAERAYLDLWRAFETQGYPVVVAKLDVKIFPKLRDRQGRAYIPQSCLIAVFKEGENSLMKSLEYLRVQKNGEIFGGLTNEQIKSLLTCQIPEGVKDAKLQADSLKTFPLRLVPAGLIAIAAQIFDQSSSTPAFAQGRIKDAIAVPVFAYLFPFTKSPQKNALIHTTLLSVWEVMQRYEPFSFRMTYDPYDIAAYGLGAVAYLGYQQVRKKSSRNL